MVDPTARNFLRSLYTSLGWAVVTLGYAVWLYLPDTAVLTGLALVGLAVAYRMEGRWSLSLSAANAVGGAIAVIVLCWTLWQFVHPSQHLLRHLPGLTKLLPLLGPLVIVVIPAKLLRPKHDGDYWGLQLIGLMGVALGCALAGDSTVTLLTCVYAAFAACCVYDFHALATGDAARRPWGRGAAFLAAALGGAVGASIVTPRFSDVPWEYGIIANRLRTGISDERPSIDLNQSGELRPSSEAAFTVTALTSSGEPRLDVPPDQRWRGITFNYYDRGKWENRRWISAAETSRGRAATPREPSPKGRPEFLIQPPSDLPDLGAKRSYFVFPYPTKANGIFFLAEPVWPPKKTSDSILFGPVRTETSRGDEKLWYARADGDVFPATVAIAAPLAWYRQVTAPTPELNLSAPVIVDPGYQQHLTTVVGLQSLRRYAADFVSQLQEGGRLPRAARLPLAPEHHETVARAMTEHLRSSGQFQYTFSLEKTDPGLDPVEDFVLNLRRGHCNRFSTALCLLLRCVGIPSRIVLGFQGAESQGDGSYIVRQSHAHSWVECVVTRQTNAGPTTHWLTLDPTPGGSADAPTESLLARWLDSFRVGSNEFLRLFVLDLTPERQAALVDRLLDVNPFQWPTGVWAAPAVASFAYLAWRRTARSDRRSRSAFLRATELGKRHLGLIATPSETPNEWLQRFTAIAPDDAAIPAARIVERHNARTYGGKPADARDDEIHLKALRQGLARSRPSSLNNGR